MVVKVSQRFRNYTDESMNKLLKDAIGKPIHGTDGNIIGKIISATRLTDDSSVVEFETEIFEVGALLQ